mmetsp:Transcript_118093/g.270926  ORF Transcript_118093/g.270926 Transcript_118093/m.270926 type:complete len:267 (+) Transcript_118093:1-801(+)
MRGGVAPSDACTTGLVDVSPGGVARSDTCTTGLVDVSPGGVARSDACITGLVDVSPGERGAVSALGPALRPLPRPSLLAPSITRVRGRAGELAAAAERSPLLLASLSSRSLIAEGAAAGSLSGDAKVEPGDTVSFQAGFRALWDVPQDVAGRLAPRVATVLAVSPNFSTLAVIGLSLAVSCSCEAEAKSALSCSMSFCCTSSMPTNFSTSLCLAASCARCSASRLCMRWNKEADWSRASAFSLVTRANSASRWAAAGSGAGTTDSC